MSKVVGVLQPLTRVGETIESGQQELGQSDENGTSENERERDRVVAGQSGRRSDTNLISWIRPSTKIKPRMDETAKSLRMDRKYCTASDSINCVSRSMSICMEHTLFVN